MLHIAHTHLNSAKYIQFTIIKPEAIFVRMDRVITTIETYMPRIPQTHIRQTHLSIYYISTRYFTHCGLHILCDATRTTFEAHRIQLWRIFLIVPLMMSQRMKAATIDLDLK